MMTKQEELATKKDLKKLEDALTIQIDGNGKKIDQVEKNLTTKIEANAAKIEANAAKIDANSATLSRLTSLVLDNQERMATKEDMNKINARLDQLISTVDGLARSFLILEQERVVINKRLDSIEAKLG